ncbi:hypothetical protein [Aliterella atlantica]|uniref:Uncharacterized protein n=1 Tax=Aliterella atlantica CENA595 TaxID=1618023 RepID=A0A0D8ZRN4_9CYAN|nr:hypothetical protein [Aliterella atlantica]KJH71385.1 hypothetical protein UH38_12555 [Aliterella atlantica CENA595]
MLLSLLTLVAMMLFGGWIFGAMYPTTGNAGNRANITSRKISLLSLILFVFFPGFYQPPSPARDNIDDRILGKKAIAISSTVLSKE